MKRIRAWFSILVGVVALFVPVPLAVAQQPTAITQDFYLEGPGDSGPSEIDFTLIQSTPPLYHPTLGIVTFICEVRGGEKGNSKIKYDTVGFSATRPTIYKVTDRDYVKIDSSGKLYFTVKQYQNCFVSIRYRLGHN